MSISVREAGRKGGVACLRNNGREFYVGIGRKGQENMRHKYPGMASVWGKRGGRPKKPNLDDMGGQGINKKEEEADPPQANDPPPAYYRHSENERQDEYGQGPK